MVTRLGEPGLARIATPRVGPNRCATGPGAASGPQVTPGQDWRARRCTLVGPGLVNESGARRNPPVNAGMNSHFKSSWGCWGTGDRRESLMGQRTTSQTCPTGGSTSRAGRTRKGTVRLKQHKTAPGWGGPGTCRSAARRGLRRGSRGGQYSAPLRARMEIHELAVVQSGGTCTDSDPADGPLGPGVRDGGPKGLTAT